MITFVQIIHMATHNITGKEGEAFARQYLEDKGYRILHCNWRYRHKELDIVASDGKELVVVEVKTRTGGKYQQPEEAVTPSKMRNLAIAANAYVKECQVDKELRFDVISIVGSEHQVKSLQHLKDAFNPMLIL